jgi:dihydrofolate reductase / thymidylate synthase
MIRHIIDKGVTKEDRTGVGTISTFGNMMRFRLDQSFPLLTTKKVFFRGVVEELLWFLRGETDGNILLQKGVKIWEGNGTKEYLQSIGLGHREEK